MISTARTLLIAVLLTVPAASARAQDPGSSEVDPLYGYMVAGLLAVGAIFVLCKSSRRSA